MPLETFTLACCLGRAASDNELARQTSTNGWRSLSEGSLPFTCGVLPLTGVLAEVSLLSCTPTPCAWV